MAPWILRSSGVKATTQRMKDKHLETDEDKRGAGACDNGAQEQAEPEGGELAEERKREEDYGK